MTSRPKDEDIPRWRGLHERVEERAVVGIAGGVLMLAALAVIPITTLVTGDNPTTSEPGDRSRVYLLDEGDCFDAGPTSDAGEDVTVLDCAGSHDSEVVWSGNFSTYGSEGDDALREAETEGETECRERFDVYDDALPPGSGVELRTYLDGGIGRMRDMGTDETRWTVACVAWSADGRFGG
jgi:hypothetical protein